MPLRTLLRGIVLAFAATAAALGVRAPRGVRTDAPRRVRASARLQGWDRRRGLREARLRAGEGLRILARPRAFTRPRSV
ncbi:hypothetical protein [Mesoterricola sediminis]|uniref:Uncharacterized protein n=1 Tax=Mesoterricola sediminis TaxID=2927980 RepID=A0AA48KCK4_9BACT|nr:hypothetical protein [Mesoterricola sediminis]BDU77239.1 hypothetical protein METESE_21970 [Mesoterricola sediminis]